MAFLGGINHSATAEESSATLRQSAATACSVAVAKGKILNGLYAVRFNARDLWSLNAAPNLSVSVARCLPVGALLSASRWATSSGGLAD